MVYPSQGREVKTAILKALDKHRSPHSGLGYNTLFGAVNSKVGGSRRTFHKYLNELISSGAVKKERDLRHKVGVVIYKTEIASQEQILMDLVEKIVAMEKQPLLASLPKADEKWEKAMKIVVLSNILGRHLASIEPVSKPGWYAYARVIRRPSGETVKINFTSDDETEGGEYTIETHLSTLAASRVLLKGLGQEEKPFLLTTR